MLEALTVKAEEGVKVRLLMDLVGSLGANFNQKGFKALKEAGADVVGMQTLFEEFQAGTVTCDVVIATPEAMALVGKLGPILGPRGLMPNPKVGTVTKNVASAVRRVKAGEVRYRADRRDDRDADPREAVWRRASRRRIASEA